jgi:hypothetical protein
MIGLNVLNVVFCHLCKAESLTALVNRQKEITPQILVRRILWKIDLIEAYVRGEQKQD